MAPTALKLDILPKLTSCSAFRRLCLSLLVVAGLCVPVRMPAQSAAGEPAATFDLDKDRELNVPLGGKWRFQTGDDADGKKGWARPQFDDSKWALIDGDESWTGQGFRDYAGSAWYRARLIVPANSPALALYVPYVEGSYQVFVDGRVIATEGGFPPGGWEGNSHPKTVLLPIPMSGASQQVSLAIRVWNQPQFGSYGGGLRRSVRGSIRVGERRLIDSASKYYDWAKAYDSVSMILLTLLELLGGVTALALFVSRRTEREYLWFGIALLLSSTSRELVLHYRFHLLNELVNAVLYSVLVSAARLAYTFFYAKLLEAKRGWLYWVAIASTLASMMLDLYVAVAGLGVGLTSTLEVLLQLPFAVWVTALVLRRAWRGVPDARLLIAPVLLIEVVNLGVNLASLSAYEGWIQALPRWMYEPVSWPFSLSLYDIPDTLFLLAMLVILVRRFTRTRRHEENYEREREAARTVQQVLIPEAIASVPGFDIESVYRPFGEVGGDFFQIMPNQEGAYAGSVLIAIGDVSGKGLPAALTVSLLVGTLRTLAHYTQSPGAILKAMNRRMSGRSNGGFTTCLVLRADADGSVVMANAGHLSPYRNGEEMAVEAGLPLGLNHDADYPEMRFVLEEGVQLTLLTDGVVEARSKNGELFGFARTQAMSGEAAESISATAEAFGQDDDITVLQLMRVTKRRDRALANAEGAE